MKALTVQKSALPPKRFKSEPPEPGDPPRRKRLIGKLKPDQSPEDATAEQVIEGLAANAAAIDRWSSVFGELDMGSLFVGVNESAQRVRDGDLTDAEGMLMAQGTTLNAVFTHLLFQARETKIMDHLDKYMRLALKAQSQSRATFETLSVMKNPPVFARQANIANGPQQVNNGVLPQVDGHAHAGKQDSRPIELLEAKHAWVDRGAPEKAGTGDKALEAVGVIHRTKERRGKGAVV